MTRYLCALMMLTCFAFVGCSAEETKEPVADTPPASTAPADKPKPM